jgi:hypothetical protein
MKPEVITASSVPDLIHCIIIFQQPLGRPTLFFASLLLHNTKVALALPVTQAQ